MECNKQIVNTALNRSLNSHVDLWATVFRYVIQKFWGRVYLGRRVYSAEYGIRILNFKKFIFVSTVMNKLTNPIYLRSSIYLTEYHYFCVRKGYLSATNPNV